MIHLVKNITQANAVTHKGTFHADDVFSAVFLSKIMEVYLYRTEEITSQDSIEGKIVFDIGLGEFDHHGQNARIRENQIKYSAFGLLFEKYGRDYLKQKNVEEIEACYQAFLRELVLQIDAIDNGIFPSNPENYTITMLSQVIELLNATWKEHIDSDERFKQATEIAEIIFNRIEKRILDKFSAKEFVEEAIMQSTKNILYLKEYMPFMEFVLESKLEKASKILFAIFPSNRGGYNIRAINKALGNHQNRLDFPKEWGGKSQEELIEMTEVPTFRFCHTNLFLCACDTLEDAYRIAELAIKQK